MSGVNWPTVVLAVAPAVVTGLFGFGGLWWQQHRRDGEDTKREKADAYNSLISRSLSFAIRARSLRSVMQFRSGLGEGFSMLLGQRAQLDALQIHDWLAADFVPINDAWTHVQVFGTDEAIDASTELIDAAADLVGIATTPGTQRGSLGTSVRGVSWTEAENTALAEATTRLIAARAAFIAIARKELQ